MARPIEAELKADFFGFDGTEVSVFYSLDGSFIDGNEGEIGRDGRGNTERRPRAQVIGHPLQPLEYFEPRQPQAADENKDGEGQKARRTPDGLELHCIELNKKPEQLKAALVFEMFI